MRTHMLGVNRHMPSSPPCPRQRPAPTPAPRHRGLRREPPGNVYRRVRRPDGGYHFDYLSNGLFRQFDIDPGPLLAQTSIRFD